MLIWRRIDSTTSSIIICNTHRQCIVALCLTHRLQVLPVRFVVGIDFGTTFSGFTYGVVGGNGDILEAWNYPGATHHVRYPKVPTALLYDKSMPPKPTHWGWEAEDNKHENPAGFTKLFKLCLAPARMRIEPYPSPQGVTQQQSIADFLRLMKEFILDTIQAQTPNMNRDQILQQTKWCLTVPAIWEEYGRDQMRIAAESAGMIASRRHPGGSPIPLLIVLEPEGASMFVARDPDFQRILFGHSPVDEAACH